MKILPAIDILGGQVVRLMQGDYDQKTVYDNNPAKIAAEFLALGAKNLHVVDLDGAKDGEAVNYDIISSLAKDSVLEIEVGGGIRDFNRIEGYLNAGAKRVILGSVAATDPNFVSQAVRKYGKSIAVGVDARDEKVAIHGWKTVTDVNSIIFCRKMFEIGVSTIIYTDISKDGAGTGTNLEVYRKLSEIHGLNIIASGGITFESELYELQKMNIYGAILGKAIYSGKLDLAEVLRKFK